MALRQHLIWLEAKAPHKLNNPMQAYSIWAVWAPDYQKLICKIIKESTLLSKIPSFFPVYILVLYPFLVILCGVTEVRF